jgi:hypothetical protein
LLVDELEVRRKGVREVAFLLLTSSSAAVSGEGRGLVSVCPPPED